MIAFQLHSDVLECDLSFKFDLNGRITGFEILGENNMGGEQLTNFLANLPQSVGQLKQYCIKKKIELIEIKPDLTFETFWIKYNYKDGASKKKTEVIWDKMSQKDKAAALNFIPKYEQRLIRQGVAKMYATTYLNQKRWE